MIPSEVAVLYITKCNKDSAPIPPECLVVRGKILIQQVQLYISFKLLQLNSFGVFQIDLHMANQSNQSSDKCTLQINR